MEQLYAFHYRLETPSEDRPNDKAKSSSKLEPSASVSAGSISDPLANVPSPVQNIGHAVSSVTEGHTGWDVYSPREEFLRMGVGSKHKGWRFTDINKDYSVSFFTPFPPHFVQVFATSSD